MSAISSVGSDPSLYSLLQTLSGQTSSSTSSTTSSATPAIAATDPDGDGSSVKGSGHHGGHHHGGGGGGLSTQLESSITSALQSAPPGSDPNTVIQQAIQNQLEGKAADGSPLPPSDPNATASASGTNAADPQSAFAQLLQSNGVDPKAFHQDLQSAIQSGQQNGGQVDFSKLFQNLPPGSTVDTVA